MSLKSSENKELVNLEYQINSTKAWLDSLEKEEDYNFSEIKSKIGRIFDCAGGYSKDFFFRYFITDGLYRARKHDVGQDLFHWTSDFWYRDWSKVNPENWRYERLNMPGENVWYFSTSMKACIAEVRPEKNDIISIANIKQFTFPRRFNFLLHIGSASLREGDSALDNMHEEAEKYHISKFSKFEKKKLKLIDDFFDEIFLTQVSEKESHKYIPSIVIAHIFRHSLSGTITDGIVYPSIAYKREKAVNIALLNPKLDETNFYLYRAIQFKVLKAEQNKFYEVEPVCVGKNFHENKYGNFPICWDYPSLIEKKKYNLKIEVK